MTTQATFYKITFLYRLFKLKQNIFRLQDVTFIFLPDSP